MYGPHNTWSSNAGFKLFDTYARNLPGVERLSLYESVAHGALVPRRQEDRVGAQADRRRVLAHPRLHVPRRRALRHGRRRRGAVRRGHQRARRAQRFFGGRPARRPDARGRRPALPRRRRRRGRVGDAQRAVRRHLGALHHGEDRRLQARDHGRLQRDGAGAGTRRRWPRIHEEFNSRLLRVELPDPKDYKAIVAPFETKFEGVRPR